MCIEHDANVWLLSIDKVPKLTGHGLKKLQLFPK